MIFYKPINVRNNKNFIINKSRYINKKKKKLLYSFFKKPNLGFKKYSIVLPYNWECICIQNKESCYRVIYFFSKIYYFKLAIPSANTIIFFDKSTHVLTLNTVYVNNYYKTYWYYLLQIFESLNKPFFMKVKFKGKGYYIYKNKRHTITSQFGHSHRLYVYGFFVSVVFLSKTHVFIFGLVYSDIITMGYNIKKMKPINIFTGRGVRFSRQIIYKKTGKVSSYR